MWDFDYLITYYSFKLMCIVTDPRPAWQWWIACLIKNTTMGQVLQGSSRGATSTRLAFALVFLSESFLFVCFFSLTVFPLISVESSYICGTHKPVCVFVCVCIYLCASVLNSVSSYLLCVIYMWVSCIHVCAFSLSLSVCTFKGNVKYGPGKKYVCSDTMFKARLKIIDWKKISHCEIQIITEK